MYFLGFYSFLPKIKMDSHSFADISIILGTFKKSWIFSLRWNSNQIIS